MRLFLDTNCFLQLKELHSLPWVDIFDESELWILVPRTVQGEIDRLKQDGNGRRSRRARKASALLRETIRTADERLLIRESLPRVVLGFPPVVERPRANPSTLDQTRADDQIVAEVLNYMQEHPLQQVAVLTNDSGLMLTARHHKCALLRNSRHLVVRCGA